MSEYVPTMCPNCGARKSGLMGGKEVFYRCMCDWKLALAERLVRTVHRCYMGPPCKTMANWNPSLFAGAPAAIFPAFFKAQRAMMFEKLWEFAWADTPAGRMSALRRSISENKNLYVRGPTNSGRGLISACIKVVAAMKNVSATPLPAEFDVFKEDMSDSKGFGKEGLAAKSLVTERYLDVQLLVLEELRAEVIIKFTREETPVRHRAADEIDGLLARRQLYPGSLLMTSGDFVGQVINSLGDRLLELLLSEKTSLVVMLHPDEVDELLQSLVARHASLIKAMDGLRKISSPADKKRALEGRLGEGELAGRKGLLESRLEEESLSLLEDALYLEDAFREVPTPTGLRVQDVMEMAPEDFPRKMLEIYEQFKEGRVKNGAAYRRGIQMAQLQAVKSCKVLKDKMVDKEMIEVGRTMSLATNEGLLKEANERAKGLRDLMSGTRKEDVHGDQPS